VESVAASPQRRSIVENVFYRILRMFSTRSLRVCRSEGQDRALLEGEYGILVISQNRSRPEAEVILCSEHLVQYQVRSIATVPGSTFVYTIDSTDRTRLNSTDIPTNFAHRSKCTGTYSRLPALIRCSVGNNLAMPIDRSDNNNNQSC
jgi:hypothetical protein